MKKYDSIVKHFTDHGRFSERPPQLKHPHLDKDNVIATNGHILIIIPTTLLGKEYKSIERYPNYESVIPKQKTYFESPIPILYQEIKTVFEKIQKYETCDYCEGEGVLFTKRGVERDKCGECAGKMIIPHIEGNIYSDDDRVKIGEAYFQPVYIGTILKVMEVNKTDKIFHLAGREQSQNLFEFNGIKIILMPTNQRYADVLSVFNSHEVKYGEA